MVKNKLYTLLPVLVFLLILLIWEIIVLVFSIPVYLLPKPSQIISVLLSDFGRLIPHIRITFFEAFLGFLIGSFFGWLLAVIFSFSETIEKALYPYAIALKSVPIVALAPLLVVWFGNGLLPKVLISAIISFFPVVVNVVKGIKTVDTEAIDLFNSLSATKRQIFTKLQFYNSMPYLFSALRISATLSVIGAIVGEFSGADKGLGFFILISSHRLETIDMFIGIVLSSIMGILFFYFVNILEKWIAPWSKDYNIT
jgi:NitT/TauT family transport system permease protein